MRNLFGILLFFTLFSCASTYKKEALKTNEGVVAVSRFQIEGGKTLEEFLMKLEREVTLAKTKGAKYLLFPELPIFDLYSVEPKNVSSEMEKVISYSSKIESFLEALAKDEKMYLVGFSQYIKVNKKIINRSYVFGPEGRLGFQDKINPTPWELKHLIAKGKNEIKKFQTEDFSFVILICHDAEFPNLSVKLKSISPEVIFVPSQTDDKSGQNRVLFTSRARAIENMSYVYVSGDTGVEKAKWHTYEGGASFYTPQNKYFDLGGIDKLGSGHPVHFDFDKEKLRKSRLDKSQVYPLRDL